MTAVLEPRNIDSSDLTTESEGVVVEITTAELLDIEAELIYRIVEGVGLCDAERYRLVAVERELNRRWSIR